MTNEIEQKFDGIRAQFVSVLKENKFSDEVFSEGTTMILNMLIAIMTACGRSDIAADTVDKTLIVYLKNKE